MEKLIYTWEQQVSDTNKICNQIEKDEFTPDVVEVDSEFVDMEDADLNSQNQASSINKTVPNTGIL